MIEYDIVPGLAGVAAGRRGVADGQLDSSEPKRKR